VVVVVVAAIAPVASWLPLEEEDARTTSATTNSPFIHSFAIPVIIDLLPLIPLKKGLSMMVGVPVAKGRRRALKMRKYPSWCLRTPLTSSSQSSHHHDKQFKS